MNQQQATYLKLMGIQPWCKQEDLPAIRAQLAAERLAKKKQAEASSRERQRENQASILASLAEARNIQPPDHPPPLVEAAQQSSRHRAVENSPAEELAKAESLEAHKRVQLAKVTPPPSAEGQSQIAGEISERKQYVPAEYPTFHSVFDESFSNALQQCRACYLADTRQRALTGFGSPAAKICVITDLPLKSEERQGTPVDMSLRPILERAFQAVKITAHELYYTPFIKCRPGELMDVDQPEKAACEHYLSRELEEIEPKMLFLLGRNATKLILGKNAPLSLLRRQVHKVEIGGKEYRAVVSHSPNMLTKRAQYKSNFWQDLKYLRQALMDIED